MNRRYGSGRRNSRTARRPATASTPTAVSCRRCSPARTAPRAAARRSPRASAARSRTPAGSPARWIASRTRRSTTGMSSTLSYSAGTVSMPRNRCSPTSPPSASNVADGEVVRVHGTQRAGRAGPGDHQQVAMSARPSRRAGANVAATRRAVAEQRRGPESGSARSVVRPLTPVVPVAEEREVAVGEPAQQLGDVGRAGAVGDRASGAGQRVGELARAGCTMGSASSTTSRTSRSTRASSSLQVGLVRTSVGDRGRGGSTTRPACPRAGPPGRRR